MKVLGDELYEVGMKLLMMLSRDFFRVSRLGPTFFRARPLWALVHEANSY